MADQLTIVMSAEEANKGQELDWRLNIQDPQQQAELGAAQAKARDVLSRRDMGIGHNRVEALVTNVEADLRERGVDERWVQVARGSMGLERTVLRAAAGTDEVMLQPHNLQTIIAPLIAIDQSLRDILMRSLGVQTGMHGALESLSRKQNTSAAGAINTHSE